MSRAQSASPQQVEAFFNLIQHKDTNAVANMLESNSNLARARYEGRLPLHVAASGGSVEIVQAILKNGADINARGDTMDTGNAQMTALCAAISCGYSNVYEQLLQSGADPNIQSTFDGGALHYALERRRTNLVERLLYFGADPFLKKDNPYNAITPFELEITHSDGTAVPQMLVVGRKLDESPQPRSTRAPNQKAISKRLTVTEFVAERGWAVLVAATQRGELDAVQALVDAGVPVKGTNAPPILQVLAAAEATAAKTSGFDSDRWSQMFAFLIKQGADHDVFAATGLGDSAQVQRLLSQNKQLIEARDRDGQTPLHWAVQSDKLPMTTFWIQSGVSLAATNSAGQAALHVATTKGLAEQVKLLLAAHAPTELRDTNGWTPLDAAVQAKQTAAIRVLLADKTAAPHPERGISTSLHEAAASGNIVLLSTLTETATNLEARDELGFTPLQLALQHGHLAAAALLVDKGADLRVRDSNGNTLLHRVFFPDRQLIVYDRPPTSWLDRMGSDPRKDVYRQYLTVGQYEQGPHPILQSISFLLACGLDAKATNGAGQTAMQLATDEKVIERLLLFDEDRTALLKLLGTAGADVNQRDANGGTALHSVTGDYSAEQVASLIASGADINATNAQGRTPLHVFAEHINGWAEDDSAEPFQLLLKSKPNVNAQDLEGLTPLHLVALSDSSFRKEATQALLAAGANPNLRDKHGRTPVHAFLSGKWPWHDATDCISQLAKAGADLSAKDNRGWTPLHYLAALGTEQPMFFLRNIGDVFLNAKVDIHARDNDGNTPLHIAAKYGTHDVFEWLVKHGASSDETNNAGENARALAACLTDSFARSQFRSETDIYLAARNGNLEAVSSLLKDNPELLNEPNMFGQTLLFLAVQTRRTNVIEFLDQKGAKWDANSAVRSGRIDKIKEILADNPDAVMESYNGMSLIDLAVNAGNLEAVKALLDHHADVAARSPWGFSALGIALAQNRTEIADLLRQHGATENIFDAVYSGDIPKVKNLFSADKSLVHASSRSGLNLVEIAARTDNVNMLNLLFDSGESATVQNEQNGRTPLHMTACYDSTNVASLLLKKAANVNAIDGDGFSPLHLAAMRGSTGVAALLLKNKADANAQVGETRTTTTPFPLPWANGLAGCAALHLAAMYGETNIMLLLLQRGASVDTTNANGLTAWDLATRQNWLPAPMMMESDLARAYGPLAGYGGSNSNALQRLFNQRTAAAEILKDRLAGGADHAAQ